MLTWWKSVKFKMMDVKLLYYVKITVRIENNAAISFKVDWR